MPWRPMQKAQRKEYAYRPILSNTANSESESRAGLDFRGKRVAVAAALSGNRQALADPNLVGIVADFGAVGLINRTPFGLIPVVVLPRDAE